MTAALSVLIVDDDKPFAAVVVAQLRAAGYQTLVAYDAMQGFMFAQRQLPGLILLDLNMPAGGGMDLLRKLTTGGRTSGIPVVMITAETRAELEAEVMRQGAAGFLTKPVDPAALLAKIQQVLGASP